MGSESDGFDARADALLDGFMETIDAALGDDLDVDLEQGILIIEFDSGGQYVINKHAPSEQLWMSSPFSGATHFNFDADTGDWVSSRGVERLVDMLAAELEKATGTAVSL
ncbi:MAG: iron donor protein CyaY [Alphaproteobacteria bacterium]